MKMYNSEVQKFVEFLMKLELDAKPSRMRTRFCKVASERVKELEENRLELLKKHCNNDENGNPSLIQQTDGSTVFDMTPENQSAFSAQYIEMMNEEFVLDNTDERKDMLIHVRNVVENVDLKFSGLEALEYDRWCEIVETIDYK